MKKFNTLLIRIIFILSILTLICMNVDARELGVGPSYIIEPNMLKGSEYMYTVFIFNTGNDYDNIVRLTSEGETKNWTTFYEYGNTSLPINLTYMEKNSEKSIFLNVAIPADTPNGLYNGTVVVTARPINLTIDSGNQTVVNVQLPILLSFMITGEQVINATVEYTKIDEVEINYPSVVSFKFKNTGNIYITPEIDVVIYKDDMYITRFYHEDFRTYNVPPGNLGEYSYEWDTTGMVSGVYQAKFNITLDGNILHQETKTFELFPPGTFTREGMLKKLSFEGVLEKEKRLKIIATFTNTGEVDTTAKFIGEIYRNGDLLDTIESSEAYIEKHETKEFNMYYLIGEDGSYIIKGHVEFEGRQTNILELDFQVGNQIFGIFAGEGTNATYLGLILVICVVIFVFVLYFLNKKEMIDVKKISSNIVGLKSTIIKPLNGKKPETKKDSMEKNPKSDKKPSEDIGKQHKKKTKKKIKIGKKK